MLEKKLKDAEQNAQIANDEVEREREGEINH
jgi:hypothetical protein